MGLQQTSSIGAESKVGLEVMLIDSVTLSDGCEPEERTPTRLIGAALASKAGIRRVAQNQVFCALSAEIPAKIRAASATISRIVVKGKGERLLRARRACRAGSAGSPR